MKKSFNPALEAARNKALELASPAFAAAAAPVVSPTKVRTPPKIERIQVIVRLTPSARDRLRNASAVYRLTEQELVERFALTLPEPTTAPPLPF